MPVGNDIEIVGTPLAGTDTTQSHYLYYDFSRHFGQSQAETDYKEIILNPGQYLGIVKGRIGYTYVCSTNCSFTTVILI